MADPLFWADGYYSPHTNATSIELGAPKFLCHPSNNPGGVGWGEPFIDEETQLPLPLGTLGGVNQIKKLKEYKSEWTKRNQPGNQVFGNIDWRGPLLKTLHDGTEIRTRYTWNGPRQRYFPDVDFDYEAEESFDIYHKGKYLAVSPFPVLGAASKKQTKTVIQVDEDTGELVEVEIEIDTLYVIGKDRLEDVVIMYYLSGAEYEKEALTSDIRLQFQTPYNETTNPVGYVELYRVEAQEKTGDTINEVALQARTPWFFNESCTQAACMREVEGTYTDNYDDSYTETTSVMYLMEVGDLTGEGFDFTYAGNLARPFWIEKHRYEIYNAQDFGGGSSYWCGWSCGPGSFGSAFTADEDAKCEGDNIVTHPDAPCSPGCSDLWLYHMYMDFRLYQQKYMIGSQVIAVDYDGDQKVTAKIEIDCMRTHQRQFLYGVDCDTFYGQPLKTMVIGCAGETNFNGIALCPDTNGCENDGRPQCPWDIDAPRFFGDGSNDSWIGGDALYKVVFSNSTGNHEFKLYEDRHTTAYAAEHDGVPYGENDTVFAWHGFTKRFIHFMDLRGDSFFSFTELDLVEFISYDDKGREGQTAGDIGSTFLQRESYRIGETDPVVITEVEIANLNQNGRIFGFDHVGAPDTAANTDWGGPNWGFSQDYGIENPESTAQIISITALPFTYSTDEPGWSSYVTVFHRQGWDELSARNSDTAIYEPLFDAYYGLLKEHRWPNWYDFFSGTLHEEFSDTAVNLSLVEGGLAVHEDDWLLSYKVPYNIMGDEPPHPGSDVYVNLLSGDDPLPLFYNEPDKLYPLGVY